MTEPTVVEPSVMIGGRKVLLTLRDQTLPKGTRVARYGWVIDRDELHLEDPVAHERNSAGVMGPRSISAEIAEMLRILTSSGFHGRAFRIHDKDGSLLYSGRIITSDAAIGTSRDFAPVDDYAGESISFWDPDGRRWRQL